LPRIPGRLRARRKCFTTIKKYFVICALLVSAALAWAQAPGTSAPDPGAVAIVFGAIDPVTHQYTTIPYVITKPGHYYLPANFPGPISIQSSDVVLDLNGYEVVHVPSWLTVSPSWNSLAISVYQQSNVTIKNGGVAKDVYGEAVSLWSCTNCTVSGISAETTGVDVISDTHGIGNSIVNNNVAKQFTASPWYGISLKYCNGDLVEGNQVSGMSLGHRFAWFPGKYIQGKQHQRSLRNLYGFGC